MAKTDIHEKTKRVVMDHPCLNKEAHNRAARVHLPVAPVCNIQCRYCTRKCDCVNESRPGVTSTLLNPQEALERIRVLAGRNEKLRVVGIAGPGDPLANDATFSTFRMIHREFPDMILCVSTNGMLLPAKLDELIKSGVSSITVTINAVSPRIAKDIYAWVGDDGVRYVSEEGSHRLLVNQWEGLYHAVEEGLVVKVNSVYLPGVNDDEIPQVARLAGKMGAFTMNVIPLIPQAEFSHFVKPDCMAMYEIRKKCGEFINLMTHCNQCRADAYGILGQDGDMELDTLNAQIGEDYCEVV